MVQTLYSILIGSLLVLAIVFVWVVIVAIVISAMKQVRKHRH